MNRKKLRRLFLLLLLASVTIVFIPMISFSEGGGGTDAALTHKISTEGLSSFNKWWVDMYNDDRVLYSLCVTGIMLCLGVIIGFGTDYILRLFGFKTTKIAHHE
jgi:hypothetical protein